MVIGLMESEEALSSPPPFNFVDDVFVERSLLQPTNAMRHFGSYFFSSVTQNCAAVRRLRETQTARDIRLALFQSVEICEIEADKRSSGALEQRVTNGKQRSRGGAEGHFEVYAGHGLKPLRAGSVPHANNIVLSSMHLQQHSWRLPRTSAQQHHKRQGLGCRGMRGTDYRFRAEGCAYSVRHLGVKPEKG